MRHQSHVSSPTKRSRDFSACAHLRKPGLGSGVTPRRVGTDDSRSGRHRRVRYRAQSTCVEDRAGHVRRQTGLPRGSTRSRRSAVPSSSKTTERVARRSHPNLPCGTTAPCCSRRARGSRACSTRPRARCRTSPNIRRTQRSVRACSRRKSLSSWRPPYCQKRCAIAFAANS